MLTTRLQIRRTARMFSRGGFTLVELLVVIGIIAILAGVALGPITNGIKQAKHNSAMQNGRQIGAVCFAYATDNSNTYPSDTKSEVIANKLLNNNYCNDPGLFLVQSIGATKVPYVPAAGVFNLVAKNIQWNFTAITATATGGVNSSTSDLIPLVYFSDATAVTYPVTAGTPTSLVLSSACPFGLDGVAVFYKGNNAVYLKAGTTTAGTVDNFISGNCADTTTYVEVVP